MHEPFLPEKQKTLVVGVIPRSGTPSASIAMILPRDRLS